MPLPSSGASNLFAQYYYTKIELNAGQLNTLYFAESEHLNTSAGAGDAGKPIKLDASGKIDASMIASASIDHGALTGLTDDDHTQYALLAGRSGGQTLIGDTAANGDITIHGTSSATKTTSYVVLQPTGGKVGIGNGTPSAYLDIIAPAGTLTVFSAAQGGVSNGFVLSSNGSAMSADMTGTLNASALTVGGVAVPTISSVDTLTNKTLTTPTISGTGFTNAQHAHAGASSGGQIAHSALSGIGSNNHSTIDTLLGDASTHYSAITGIHGVGAGAIVGTTNTQTLTNKTLTTPIIATVYGSAAANGDITIDGTSSATKTTSYVTLQSTGGNVGVGTTSPDYLFEVEATGYTLALAPNYTANENYILSTLSAALAPLTLYGSAVKVAGDSINIAVSQSPTSGGTGVAGEIAWDTGFLYVCTATNTWERVALTGGY